MDAFQGIKKLVSPSDFDKIQQSSVLVVGLGGVGSWAVEALARTGVGKITVVDPDSVCISNINRQLIATRDSVGTSKVEVMKARILNINPNCEVNTVEDFFCEDTCEEIFNTRFDFAFDGIDRLKNKILFLQTCIEKKNTISYFWRSRWKKLIHLLLK